MESQGYLASLNLKELVVDIATLFFLLLAASVQLRLPAGTPGREIDYEGAIRGLVERSTGQDRFPVLLHNISQHLFFVVSHHCRKRS